MINDFAESGEAFFSHRQVQKGLPSNCHYPRLRVTPRYNLPEFKHRLYLYARLYTYIYIQLQLYVNTSSQTFYHSWFWLTERCGVHKIYSLIRALEICSTSLNSTTFPSPTAPPLRSATRTQLQPSPLLYFREEYSYQIGSLKSIPGLMNVSSQKDLPRKPPSLVSALFVTLFRKQSFSWLSFLSSYFPRSFLEHQRTRYMMFQPTFMALNRSAASNPRYPQRSRRSKTMYAKARESAMSFA